MKVRGCSRDDKPVFIEEIQAGNQKVRPNYLTIYHLGILEFYLFIFTPLVES